MSLAAAKSRGRRWSRLWQWSECREGLLTRAGGKGKKQLDSGEAREREELDGECVPPEWKLPCRVCHVIKKNKLQALPFKNSWPRKGMRSAPEAGTDRERESEKASWGSKETHPQTSNHLLLVGPHCAGTNHHPREFGLVRGAKEGMQPNTSPPML